MSLDKAIWGPAFWALLHGLAERLGQAADEAQEWARWIRYLSEVLPCPICQEHAHIVRRPDFARLHGEALQREAREWTYNFHESVRQRLRPGERPFPYDQLGAYRGRDLTQEAEIVLNAIQLGVQGGIIRAAAAAAWRTHFARLKLLLGLEGHVVNAAL